MIIFFFLSFFLSLILVPQAEVSRRSKLIGEELVAVGGIILMAGTWPTWSGGQLAYFPLVSSCSLLFPLREYLPNKWVPPVT